MEQSIAFVLGTARQGRKSEHVTKYVYKKCADLGLHVEFIDVKDMVRLPHTIPDWENNDATLPWRTIAQKSAGFIFVVPEYSRSFPGEFKLLLDQDLKNYEGKPALMCTVSSGDFAGVRMHENIQSILNYMKFRVVPAPLHFGKVEAFVTLSDEEKENTYGARVAKSIEAFKAFLS